MPKDLYRVVLKGYSIGKGEYYMELEFVKLFKTEHEKTK